MIELTKSNGVKVVLDTDGDGLRVGLRAIPNVIKPNIHELSRLVGRELTTTNNIIEAARHIHNQGVDIVLVSMGAKGILLIGEKEEYLAAAPVVKVKNTIGAGDSAVAGFVYGLVNGVPLKEALTYAVAAGTATTLRVGTALCQKDDFLKLVPEIQLQSIEPN